MDFNKLEVTALLAAAQVVIDSAPPGRAGILENAAKQLDHRLKELNREGQ